MSTSLQFKVGADIADIRAKLAAVRADIHSLTGTVNLRLNNTQLAADIAHARTLLASLGGTSTININTGNLEKTLKKLVKAMRELVTEISTLRGSLGGSLGGGAAAADVARLERELRNLRAQMDSMRGSAGGVGSAFAGLRGQIAQLLSAFAGLYSVHLFLSVTDEAKKFEGQLRLVTQSQQELISVHKQLLDISNRTGTQLSSNIDLYSRLKDSTSNIDVSNDQLIKITETIAKAGAIGGDSAVSLDAALVQFGQALGNNFSNAAQELNSIAEQARGLKKVLIEGGGFDNFAQLKKAAEEGKFGAVEALNAILAAQDKTEERYAKMQRTSNQSLTALKNDLKEAIAVWDKDAGISDGFIKAVDGLRESLPEIRKMIDEIMTAAKIAGAALIIAFAPAVLIASISAFSTLVLSLTSRLLLMSAASRTAAGSVLTLRAAFMSFMLVFAAAFAGWKFGEWMRKESEAVAQFGNKLGAFLFKLVNEIKLHWEQLNSYFSNTAEEHEKMLKKIAADRKAYQDVIEEPLPTGHEAPTDEKSKRDNMDDEERAAFDQSAAANLKNLDAAYNQRKADLLKSLKQLSADATPAQQTHILKIQNEYKDGDFNPSELVKRLSTLGFVQKSQMEDIANKANLTQNTATAYVAAAKKYNEAVNGKATEKPKDGEQVNAKPATPVFDKNASRKIDLEAAIAKDEVNQNYSAKAKGRLIALYQLEYKMIEEQKKTKLGDGVKLGELAREQQKLKSNHKNTLTKFDKDAADSAKTAQKEAQQLSKQQQAEAKRQREYQLETAVLEIQGEKQAAEYDAQINELAFKQGIRGVDSYFEEKINSINTIAAIEERFFDAKIAAETDANKETELRQQKNALEKKRLFDVSAVQAEQKKADEERKASENQLQIDLANAEGRHYDARMLEIKAKFAKLIDDLKKQGRESDVVVAVKIQKIEISKADADEAQKKANEILERQQLKENAIVLAAGENPTLREKAAADAAILASRQTAAVDLAPHAATLNMAKTAGVDGLDTQIDDLNNKILELGRSVPTTMDLVKNSIVDLGKAGISSAIDGLSDSFMALVDGSKSAGEAFKDFVRGMVMAMAQMVAKTLATVLVLQGLSLVTGIPVATLAQFAGIGLSVAGGGKSEGAPVDVIHRHTGGIADGGGTSRKVNPAVFTAAPRYHVGGIAGLKSGEVPAILEKGEEVLTRKDPRHVANGGKNAADGGGNGSNNGVRIVNVIDPNLMQDYVASSAGERVIINLLERNAGTIRQLLG